ncbi:helix-turn-helix transcriptional regulator [Undibacterium griseum]|uniref:AlpA family phage regulatory protein n=1 Tax=Undibacterium griseum TaxID=2762295 RepID=A0ABR6YP13_9BURK|nr:AlpA family phage regulatory protein [Undibacterium griseum]MBC3885636.1 AlpA family phage regulatory protein [Undibacterium griseum]
MGDIPKFDQLLNKSFSYSHAPIADEPAAEIASLPICRIQILEVAPICRLLSCSRVTLWRIRQNDPTFPLPVSLSDNKTIRFVEHEIHEWLRKKMDARKPSSVSHEGS